MQGSSKWLLRIWQRTPKGRDNRRSPGMVQTFPLNLPLPAFAVILHKMSTDAPLKHSITLISVTVPMSHMKISRSCGMIVCALFCVMACIMLPVSGLTVPQVNPATTTSAAVVQNPVVSASVLPAQPNIGDPVTISGVATGGNLTGGVQIWVFAGNYVNVTTVPVNANGTFSKTYQTAGLPPATYYVIVQSPGNDGILNIVMQTSGRYSGDVTNAKTGANIFNFTGTGSVQDAAAPQPSQSAFNLPGVDDALPSARSSSVYPGPLPHLSQRQISRRNDHGSTGTADNREITHFTPHPYRGDRPRRPRRDIAFTPVITFFNRICRSSVRVRHFQRSCRPVPEAVKSFYLELQSSLLPSGGIAFPVTPSEMPVHMVEDSVCYSRALFIKDVLRRNLFLFALQKRCSSIPVSCGT